MEMKKQELVNNLSVVTQPIAHAIISNKKGERGVIKQVNALFCILFGLQRDEILNKKINIIMPKIYSDIHDGVFF